MTNTLFQEKQRFNQKWLMALLAIPVIIGFWGFVQQILLGEPFGNNPASDLGLIISVFLPILIVAFIFFLNLNTRIDKTGITYQFRPVHRKEQIIKWEEVSCAYVRKYKPITEYGGWGFRHGRKGKALNTSGNMGLQIEFVNGKNLLIGTQKPEELERVLQKLEIKGKSAQRI